MAWQALGRLTDFLLERIAGEKFADFLAILRSWRVIVGDLLAERSCPVKYENNVLFVGVKNNTWMQELILTKQRIIDAYRQKLKINIRDIIFLIRQ
ncbi:MAG: DUF721 domain-containing protein [Candidatus Cloacimonetes bacterium]|nr:DUF721 domain-containing protein [Candidatus Cloacimonadota bacterium]